MASLHFTLPPPPVAARALYLVFNLTRTFGLRARLPGPIERGIPNMSELDADHPYPNVILIDGRRGDPNADRASDAESAAFVASIRQVTIESAGEAPDLLHLVYEGIQVAGAPPVNWFALAEYCPGAEEPVLDVGPLEQFAEPVIDRILSPELYQLEVDQFLKLLPPDTVTLARCFFSDLDRKTNPFLLGAANDPVLAAAVTAQVTRVGLRLTERMDDRRAHKGAGPAQIRPLVDAGDIAHLTNLSHKFLDIARNHMPDGAGGIDLNSFSSAFEKFANGELRAEPQNDGKVICQPSSINYYQFAEFGFLAYEHGVDAAIWRPLLEVLVRTQKVYQHVYEPHSAPPFNLDSYTPCNFDEDRRFTKQDLDALAQDYAGLSYDALSERATENFHKAINP